MKSTHSDCIVMCRICRILNQRAPPPTYAYRDPSGQNVYITPVQQQRDDVVRSEPDLINSLNLELFNVLCPVDKCVSFGRCSCMRASQGFWGTREHGHLL